uniref:Uncharacterized protein n=1 Tax=Anguilla anguilla TaxID=7936 RepID=A0A0E9Q531_ANGAN
MQLLSSSALANSGFCTHSRAAHTSLQ